MWVTVSVRYSEVLLVSQQWLFQYLTGYTSQIEPGDTSSTKEFGLLMPRFFLNVIIVFLLLFIM